MYYYSTVIAEYCTAMQRCDTVQSSCDNDLRGTPCSPAFRWKGSQFVQTASSHLYALLVALGNGTLNSMGSTLSADQGTGQITLWWLLTFEGTHISSQYKLAQRWDDVHLCLAPALNQSIIKLWAQIKGVLSSPLCCHRVTSLNTFVLYLVLKKEIAEGC